MPKGNIIGQIAVTDPETCRHVKARHGIIGRPDFARARRALHAPQCRPLARIRHATAESGILLVGGME